MPSKSISELDLSASLAATELVEVSQRSASVTITATTISAAATDNSFSDSGDGFVSAGFAEGDRVNVSGFATSANNLFTAIITTLAAGKITIAGTDGDPITDEVAGESVTITKWESRRATVQDIADLGGGAVAVKDDGSEIVATASALNFTGDGVAVTDGGSGQANIAIAGGGGGGGAGGGGGLWNLVQTAVLSADASVDLEDFAGGDYAALMIVADLVPSDDGVALTARYKLNGSYKSSANYSVLLYQRATSNAANIDDTLTATGGELTGVGGTWGVGDGEGAQFVLEVMNPMNETNPIVSNVRGIHGAPSGQRVGYWGNFQYDGTDYDSALEGIQILVDNGTLTGTVRVFGLLATASGGASNSSEEFVGTYNEAGISSLDIENFFGISDVVSIRIEIEHLQPSADSLGLQMQMKLNGSYKSANYKWAHMKLFNDIYADAGNTSDSLIYLTPAGAGGAGNAATEGMSGEIIIRNPNHTSSSKKVRGVIEYIDDQGTPRMCLTQTTASYVGTDYEDALEGIKLLLSSGTFDIKCHVFVEKAVTSDGPVLVPPLAESFPTELGFQASSNLVDSPAGMLLYDFVYDPNVDFHIAALKDYPATPWTVIMKVKPTVARANYNSAGFILRDSSNGKNVRVGWTHDTSWTLTVTNYNNNTFSTHLTSIPVDRVGGWLKVEDDGTNITFSVSPDEGTTWRELASPLRTAFMTTPDYLGFYIDPESYEGNSILVEHYAQT